MDHDQPITQPLLTTPRAAAVAGIVFSLLLVALALVRVSTPVDMVQSVGWSRDPAKRNAVRLAVNIVPFAGIAFLWFIGVIRDGSARMRTGSSRRCSWGAACSSSPCCSCLCGRGGPDPGFEPCDHGASRGVDTRTSGSSALS